MSIDLTAAISAAEEHLFLYNTALATHFVILDGGYDQIARVVIEAALPLIREQLAQQIEALKPSSRQFWDSLDARTVYVINDVLKLVRGGTAGGGPDA